MRRASLPSWGNRLIDAVADRPASPLGRLVAMRYGRPDPGASDAVSRFDLSAEARVLIAPVNYSGQATAWARALERAFPSVSARSMAIDVPGGFAYPADLVVPVSTYHNDTRWQKAQSSAVSQGSSHVLVEAEEPPFGRLHERNVEAQVQHLLHSDVAVGYMAHGTDIRVPSRHRNSTRWSPFRDSDIYAPRLETLTQRNIGIIERSSLPAFVSTPDLLADLPGAVWCPVVVEPATWSAPSRVAPMTHRLRVMHAPSHSVMKGTDLIIGPVNKLSERGVIDFSLVTGLPSARMPAAYAAADVVLDQFRIGSYGVAACEAMASGCVVVGHVLPHVREEVARATGLLLPIVEATPDTVNAVLTDLAEDRDRRARIVEAGRRFVEAVHSGPFSAQLLATHWLGLAEDARGQTS